MIEDFSICHRCQQHRWCTLSCEYLCEFEKKNLTVLMIHILRGLRETDSRKKLEVEKKIS
jgi:hypothetical protein